MQKKPIKLILIAAAVIGGLLVLKNVIAQAAVIGGVRAFTGLRVDVAGLDIGLLHTHVGIKGLRVHNPAGFSDAVMVNLPEAYVDYRLGDLLKGKTHLEEVRINLKELVVERNKQGQVNLSSVAAVQQAQGQAPVQPADAKKPQPPLQIDVLQLQIGKVVYKDYGVGPEPKVQEFPVNINERYQDIHDPRVLASLIIVKALSKTTIARLANFDVAGLKGMAGDTLKRATDLAAGALGNAADLGKDVQARALQTADEAAHKATQAAQQATQAFKQFLPGKDQ